MKKNISKIIFYIHAQLFKDQTHLNLRRLNNKAELISESIQQAKKSNYTDRDLFIFENMNNYKDKLLKTDDSITNNLLPDNPKVKVANICQKASSNNSWCKLYYCISKNIKANNILEIGTNLGVSGQYFIEALEQQNSKNNKRFSSFEGVTDLCEISRKRFDEISKKGTYVDVIDGLYDDTLEYFLKNNNVTYDLVFIDGNHKYKPTIRYFEILKKHSSKDAVFIFDDINWSNEMKQAWDELKNEDQFIALNLHRIGILIASSHKLNKDEFKLYYSF